MPNSEDDFRHNPPCDSFRCFIMRHSARNHYLQLIYMQ